MSRHGDDGDTGISICERLSNSAVYDLDVDMLQTYLEILKIEGVVFEDYEFADGRAGQLQERTGQRTRSYVTNEKTSRRTELLDGPGKASTTTFPLPLVAGVVVNRELATERAASGERRKTRSRRVTLT